MARSDAASALKKMVSDLQAERQQHVDAIEKIDATFAELGMAVPTGKKKRGPGRPKGTKKASSGGKRKRGKFAVSGDESVMTFVKSKGKARTSEVNDHWLAEGRKGKADNALGKLVKEKKLKRTNIKGERGSIYQVA